MSIPFFISCFLVIETTSFCLESAALVRLGAWRGLVFIGALVISGFLARRFRGDGKKLFNGATTFALMLSIGLGWLCSLHVGELATDDGFRLSFAQAINAFGLPIKNSWWFANAEGGPAVGYYIFTEYLAASLFSAFGSSVSLGYVYYNVLPILCASALGLSAFSIYRELASEQSIWRHGVAIALVVALAIVGLGWNGFVAEIRATQTQVNLFFLYALTAVGLFFESRRHVTWLPLFMLLLGALVGIATITKVSLAPGLAILVGTLYLGILLENYKSRRLLPVVLTMALSGALAFAIYLTGAPKAASAYPLKIAFWETAQLYYGDLTPELAKILQAWGYEFSKEVLGPVEFIVSTGAWVVGILFVGCITAFRSKKIRWPCIGALGATACMFGMLLLLRSKIYIGNPESYWFMGVICFLTSSAVLLIPLTTELPRRLFYPAAFMFAVGPLYGFWHIQNYRNYMAHSEDSEWIRALIELCDAAKSKGDYNRKGLVHTAVVHGFGAKRKPWGVAGFCSIPMAALHGQTDYFNVAKIHGGEFNRTAGFMSAIAGINDGLGRQPEDNMERSLRHYYADQHLQKLVVITREAEIVDLKFLKPLGKSRGYASYSVDLGSVVSR